MPQQQKIVLFIDFIFMFPWTMLCRHDFADFDYFDSNGRKMIKLLLFLKKLLKTTMLR